MSGKIFTGNLPSVESLTEIIGHADVDGRPRTVRAAIADVTAQIAGEIGNVFDVTLGDDPDANADDLESALQALIDNDQSGKSFPGGGVVSLGVGQFKFSRAINTTKLAQPNLTIAGKGALRNHIYSLPATNLIYNGGGSTPFIRINHPGGAGFTLRDIGLAYSNETGTFTGALLVVRPLGADLQDVHIGFAHWLSNIRQFTAQYGILWQFAHTQRARNVTINSVQNGIWFDSSEGVLGNSIFENVTVFDVTNIAVGNPDSEYVPQVSFHMLEVNPIAPPAGAANLPLHAVRLTGACEFVGLVLKPGGIAGRSWRGPAISLASGPSRITGAGINTRGVAIEQRSGKLSIDGAAINSAIGILMHGGELVIPNGFDATPVYVLPGRNRAYKAGMIVHPGAGGVAYRARNDGTTGLSEPAWPAASIGLDGAWTPSSISTANMTVDGSFPASNAIDNNIGTYMRATVTSTSSLPQITLDLGTSRAVNMAVLRSGPNANPNSELAISVTPLKVKIESSPDGSTWTERLTTFEQYRWSPGASHYWPFLSFANKISARYWRFTILQTRVTGTTGAPIQVGDIIEIAEIAVCEEQIANWRSQPDVIDGTVQWEPIPTTPVFAAPNDITMVTNGKIGKIKIAAGVGYYNEYDGAVGYARYRNYAVSNATSPGSASRIYLDYNAADDVGGLFIIDRTYDAATTLLQSGTFALTRADSGRSFYISMSGNIDINLPTGWVKDVELRFAVVPSATFRTRWNSNSAVQINTSWSAPGNTWIDTVPGDANWVFVTLRGIGIDTYECYVEGRVRSSWIKTITPNLFGESEEKRFPAGTAAAPAVAVGQSDSGLFRATTNQLAISNVGAEVLRFIGGNIIVGQQDNNQLTANAINPRLQIAGTTAGPTTISVGRWSNDTAGPRNYFVKSRGATINSNVAVQSGDVIGQVTAVPGNGTTYDEAAQIIFFARGDFSSSATRHTEIAFTTMNAGTLSTRWRIMTNGDIADGGNVPVIRNNRHFALRQYTISTLPSASNAGDMIFCTDLGGGGGQLNASGTFWRRVSRGGQQTIATDADATLTVLTNAEEIRHTGTLTADRTVTLSSTNAYNGARFRVTRTGGGAFNLSIGGLKSLATNQWAEVIHDGSSWYLAAFGSL
jgi:hypothetical protein